jgi:glycosyltransferase involved in cell wall biosynthesis
VPAPALFEPGRRPAALLVDDHWPRPDRDAGSIEIVNLAEALMGFGFEVWFAADRDHADDGSPGRDALTDKGVRCLRPVDVPSVGAFLEREGGRFALVVLNRVYCGGRFMEDARRHCTGARVVFNTIDLHHLRLQREAELRSDADGLAAAAAVREREEALAGEADATVVVSEAERDLLASVPGANLVVLPLAREIRPPRAPFEARSGVGFIGGFVHAPNVDAVRFFLAEVWPLVLRGDPRCEFSIVGAGLPPDVLDGAPGAVRYVGPVADAAPWFESLRLTVAPLRYGAGVKGKVVSSLAAGVPCVATPVAVEGMGLRDGDGVLVAATPELLAGRVLRAHADPDLWAGLSAGGLAQAAARFSPAACRGALAEALWVMDVLPEPAAATTSARADASARPPAAQPSHGRSQRLGPPRPGRPPHLAADQGRVEHVHRHVRRPAGFVHRRDGGSSAQRRPDVAQDFQDAAPDAGPDVEDPVLPRVGGGPRDGLRDVGRIEVVAHHAPVAPDLRRPPVQHGLHQRRDDALPPVRVLPGAERVGDAEHGVVQPVQVAVEVEVLLHRQLAHPVGGDRVRRRVLADRDGRGDAVHRAARG